MSACYRLVLDSVCRSNHHRLAVTALSRLEGETAGAWRDVFLRNRKQYLEGARAPDNLFRDFKNHVLHVRETAKPGEARSGGEWGGAREAAREWYRRTVRALKVQDWAHAAWCAGVMSRYVAGPVQPLHTHQSEEQGIVHRAVEWGVFRAFPELLSIIENDLGWPDVPVPSGDDWLERMIRAGAVIAGKHHETLIDHYDIEAGRRRPEDGLDQELKDVIAALMGYASVMLARVLGRAIAEAAVAPPDVSLAFDAAGIVLTSPGRAIARRADDVAERRLIAAQYAEFRRTGKVRETLSEDDRVVRRLHAEEVLRISLSSLDCLWPRETGTKHGQGAEPRRARKKAEKQPAPANSAAKATKAKTQTGAAAKPSARDKQGRATATPSPLWGGVGVGGGSTTGSSQRSAGPQLDRAKKLRPSNVAPPPTPTPPHKGEGKRGAGKKAAARPAAAPARTLTREASVVDAPSIGPKTAGKLSLIGVKTVGDLLEVSPEDAAARIRQGHINARLIRDWQAQALLACTVPGLSVLGAQLLVGAGVSGVEDLASADPDFLVDAIAMFAASGEGERALRGQSPPDRARIKSWIEAAQLICGNRSAA